MQLPFGGVDVLLTVLVVVLALVAVVTSRLQMRRLVDETAGGREVTRQRLLALSQLAADPADTSGSPMGAGEVLRASTIMVGDDAAGASRRSLTSRRSPGRLPTTPWASSWSFSTTPKTHADPKAEITITRRRRPGRRRSPSGAGLPLGHDRGRDRGRQQGSHRSAFCQHRIRRLRPPRRGMSRGPPWNRGRARRQAGGHRRNRARPTDCHRRRRRGRHVGRHATPAPAGDGLSRVGPVHAGSCARRSQRGASPPLLRPRPGSPSAAPVHRRPSLLPETTP